MVRKVLRKRLPLLFLALASLSAAAAPTGYDGDIENARLVGTFGLKGEVFHVQGLELTERRIWVTSIDEANRRAYIHEFDRASGALLRRLDLTDGDRYHPGGISIADGAIWVPVAELKPHSSAVLVQIDLETMAVRRRIPFGDHLGCVAVSGNTLVAGNWDSRLLYVIDLDGKAPVRAVANPSETRYQDMKFVDGQLVAGGNLTLWSGTVDWIDWPSLKVTQSLRSGAVGPIRPVGRGGPLTGEGMAIEGRDLYLVPEDGPSRLFRYRLDQLPNTRLSQTSTAPVGA